MWTRAILLSIMKIRKQTLKDDCFVLKYYYITYRITILQNILRMSLIKNYKFRFMTEKDRVK